MLPTGYSYLPEYDTWSRINQRCYNPNNSRYKYYGGRGIKVIWHNFEEFYSDMGPKPSGYTIERINNDGNYEKSNCKWATMEEQNWNKTYIKRYANHEKSSRAHDSTHCPHGHEFTLDNTHITPQGHRRCRACARLRDRQRWANFRSSEPPRP